MVEAEVTPMSISALSTEKDVNVTCTELDGCDVVSGQSSHSAPSSTVQAWPTQPKALVLEQKERVMYMIFDVVLIALPVLLLVKIGLCIYAHYLDSGNTGIYLDYASDLSRILVDLNAQLVTLFTIVFITIMSTFVRRYALWKAQHGASVTELEQFQGSISLPSTLRLIWSLRSFGANSIILALTWSFYYLGSQAVKLEYRLSLSADYKYLNAAIQRSSAPSYFTSDVYAIMAKSNYSTGFTNDRSYLDRLNVNFGSVIMANLDAQTMSPSQQNFGTYNGAPIIPEYETAESSTSQTSLADRYWHAEGGWIDVSKQSEHSFVSLVGQNLWVDEATFSNGTLQHDPALDAFLGKYTVYNMSYLDLNCSTPQVYPEWSFPNGTHPQSSVSFNMSGLSSTAARDRYGYQLRQLEYWYRGYALNAVPGYNTTEILPDAFDGPINYTFRAFQTLCDISTVYIDMEVSCITTGCYPSRLRWANNTDKLDAIGYSTPFDDSGFATNFLSNFLVATGNQPDIDFTTLVDTSFFPDNSINATYWSALGSAHMAQNLDSGANETSGLLQAGLNTYYMLSQAVISDYAPPYMEGLIESPDGMDEFFMLVLAHGALLDQAYRIYWQWIPVDIMACSILLAAAIGAYWLRVNTLAPDIFGYVSSLTRDNPHIQLPTEGSALSGIERARMLKSIKVRIADVETAANGESSVGRVGLVPHDANARPLHSHARYV